MKFAYAACLFLAALTLLSAGCGLLTAPASVPAAIAENSNFTFNGSVVDSSGKPLDAVVVTFKKIHHSDAGQRFRRCADGSHIARRKRI